jgi:excisionase family DNA binding protein
MAALDLPTAEDVRRIVREELQAIVADLRGASGPPAPDALLTTEQAADELGLAPKTVRRLAREGRLRGARRGASWRFLRTSIEAYRRGDPSGMVANASAKLFGVK